MPSVEEYQRRLASVQKVMEKYGVDCLLLNRPATIKYLTGASNTCSWVFVTRNGRQVALVMESDYHDYRRQSIVADIRPHRPHDPENLFRKVRAELGLGPGSLAAETEHLKTYQYWMLEGQFGEAVNRGVCADKLTEEARMVKSAQELELTRKSAQLSLHGIRVAREVAGRGATELEVALRITDALRAEGAEESPLVYVATDDRCSLSHALPTRKRIEHGPVAVDIHVNYQGYFSDAARTIFLAGGDGEAKVAYDALREAVGATIAKITAGVTLVEIRRSFHQHLKLREDWIMLFGPVVHGIGVVRPELPRFSHPWEGEGYPVGYMLEPNVSMACSNIGISSKQGWGVRYEDSFIVTDGKPVILTPGE